MSIANNAWIYKLAHTFADRLTASTAPVKVSCNSNFFWGQRNRIQGAHKWQSADSPRIYYTYAGEYEYE